MDKLKHKKIIGVSLILIIIALISLLTYGKNESNVFKDQYMNNIFVDEDSVDLTSVDEEDSNEEGLTRVKIKNEEMVENTIKENNISSNLDSNNNIVVEIKGEVLKPDVYKLNEGSIVKDLIDIAGGLTSQANISNINRARELKNHELIIIKNINDIDSEEVLEEISDDITENEESSDNCININEADLSKLKEIPGIGDVKANAIIIYREKNGGFKSIEELKNVEGIGEKTFEKIKDSIKL